MIDSTAAGVSEAKIKNRPFGAVDLTKDHFLFIQKPPSQGNCLLYFISFTPRGHDRSLIGKVDGEVWKMISKQTAEELARGMDKREKNGQALKFVNGENVLSPLPGRELAVLFWALLEDDTKKYTRAGRVWPGRKGGGCMPRPLHLVKKKGWAGDGPYISLWADLRLSLNLILSSKLNLKKKWTEKKARLRSN